MNQVVEFMNEIAEPWQASVCATLRNVVHDAIPGVQERMQYKKPHFLKNGKYVAVISTSKKAVSFTLFNTSQLELPEIFSGPSERKTLKIVDREMLDTNQLSCWVELASKNL